MTTFAEASELSRKSVADRFLALRPSFLTAELTANLGLFVLLTTDVIRNWTASHFVVKGTTEVEPVGDPATRFLAYGLALLFFIQVLTRTSTVARKTFLVILFSLTLEVIAYRFEDFTLARTYVEAVFSAGVMLTGVRFRRDVLFSLAAMYIVINIAATVLRPRWAFFVTSDTIGHLPRLSAAMNNPNELGGYCAILIVILVAAVNRKWQWLFIFPLAALLVMSQSKTAAVAALIALGFYALKVKRLPLWFVWTFPIFSLIYPVLISSSLINPQGDVGHALTVSGRTTEWSVLLQSIQDYPIFGRGADGILQALKNIRIGIDAGNHAHNTTLQYCVQGGALCVLFYLLFLNAFRNRLEGSRLGIAVFVFLLIHSITETTTPPTDIYLFCFFAVFTDFSVNRLSSRRKQEKQGEQGPVALSLA